MAYTKQTWNDGDPATAATAARMNHIEDGIAGALSSVKQTLAGFFNRWTPTGTNMIASRLFIGTPDRCNGYFFTTSGSNVWRVIDGVLQTGTTWIACGLPTNVSSGTKITDVIAYKGAIYIQGIEDTGTGNMAVWVNSAALTGAGTLTWTKVLDGSANSGSYRGTLEVLRDGVGNTGNDVALFAGEYSGASNPANVSLYRTTVAPASSSDWTVPTPFPIATASMKHIHALGFDTWSGAAAGIGYLTAGDGVTNTILKTVNGGTSWTVDQADSSWQAVQISFTPSYTWFASDSQKHTTHVKRRSDSAYMWACPNDYRNTYIEPDRYADGIISADGTTITSAALSQEHANGLAYTTLDNGLEVRADATLPWTAGTTIASVVGSTGVITLSSAAPAGARSKTSVVFNVLGRRHKWKQNAFFGCAWADPTTGREGFICVANNDQEGGDHYGLFWIPEVGGRVELVDHLWGNNGAFGRVFIYGGNIYVGSVIHPLPTLAA